MRNSIVVVLLVSALFWAGACAQHTSRGTIREHHDVTRIFRSYQVLPQYNYFYYGVFLEPDTIMGIDKKYTVKSDFWSPVRLTPEQLKTWVIRLDRKRGDTYFAKQYMWRYQGAHVLDPEGTVVGIWYSKLDWGVFEFPGENIIIPFQPSLKPRSEGHFFRSWRDD